MNHLRNLLDGAASLFGSFAPRDYRLPKRGDFAVDARNLRSDCHSVARSLRKQIDRQVSNGR